MPLLREVLPECRRARIKGELQDPCAALDCPVCLPREARRVAGALGMAMPDLMLTITSLPLQWPLIRDRMNKVIETLRRSGSAYVWAYSVERNGDGRAAHAHAFVRGPRLSASTLQDAAGRAQVGRVHQETMYTRGQALGYALKEIGRSPDLPVGEALAQQAGYLELNGQRLVHASHGYWLGPGGDRSNLRRVKVPGARVPFPKARRRVA